jgi:hypothetical protein
MNKQETESSHQQFSAHRLCSPRHSSPLQASSSAHRGAGGLHRRFPRRQAQGRSTARSSPLLAELLSYRRLCSPRRSSPLLCGHPTLLIEGQAASIGGSPGGRRRWPPPALALSCRAHLHTPPVELLSSPLLQPPGTQSLYVSPVL